MAVGFAVSRQESRGAFQDILTVSRSGRARAIQAAADRSQAVGAARGILKADGQRIGLAGQSRDAITPFRPGYFST